MNDIINLLDLEDSDILITDSQIIGRTKYLTLETRPTIHFCPSCGFRMHSHGVRTRTINHPILQDGYDLKLKLKQRRWRCTNKQCRYLVNEAFNFVSKRRRNTNAADMLIINELKDLSVSASSVAEKFGVSDTFVLETFDRYVKMDRLPLSDIVSIDEVYLELDEHCKYALVIQDFYSGEPIDLLSSRRTHDVEPYFMNIPREERNRVRYLISDMYNPYINWVTRYFPNAVPVVDSFHVVQWITHRIDMYIRGLIKDYKKRDREEFIRLHGPTDERTYIPPSREVYLLQHYKWLILSNRSNIIYHTDLRMDNHLRCMMNTYDYEDSLFMIDPQLRELRDLKELYISFNSRNAGKPLDARIELDELIHRYLRSDNRIFNDFADLLIRNHDYIISSFVMVEKHGPGRIYSSRLSNGPIESLNRKVKDLKRNGRGYRNFEHFRARFLYSTRDNPVINAVQDYDPVIHYEDED